MKKTETRGETVARLASDSRKGASAAKRFETLVRRVAKTTTPAVKAKEAHKSRQGFFA